LDERLVREELAADRKLAQALVMAGKVMIGEQKARSPAEWVRPSQPLRLLGGPPNPYVSRGGLKLAGALRQLGVATHGRRCVDVGAATGGFTDCLLQHGATAVMAVDVGHGLLADRLRRDPRVLVRERTHARDLQAANLPWPVDLLVMDVSFIGGAALVPSLVPLVRPGGELLLMVKPQFELPREAVPVGGVVTNEQDRIRAAAQVATAATSLGCRRLGSCDSELPGPAGNRELFVWLQVAQDGGE
jgi:23S rRNA (cytidine1920-2'-O)/16S rRNA (cytidine1409-2'-O)-methyltransferase